MFMSTKDYLKRISYALENVVAPELESDYARGQLYAAVFLIDQLPDRIDYKSSLIKQDIEGACDTIKAIVEACEPKAENVPENITSLLGELENGEPEITLKFRDRCNETFSSAIEYFFTNRNKLDPAKADDVNGVIVKQLMKTAGRDIGMLKMSTSDKLIQRKKDK